MLSLKNIQVFPSAREGYAAPFHATLLWQGVEVGQAEDFGKGGAISFKFSSPEVKKEIEESLKKLPLVMTAFGPMDQDLESLVAELMDNYEAQKF